MPSLLRSASWRCRLRELDPPSRRGLLRLPGLVEFVHVVRMAGTGEVHRFYSDGPSILRGARFLGFVAGSEDPRPESSKSVRFPYMVLFSNMTSKQLRNPQGYHTEAWMLKCLAVVVAL